MIPLPFSVPFRGVKPQSLEFLYLEAVQTLTSRNSLVNDKIIGYILWPNVMITINTCVYNRLWRFLLTSSVSQKVKREGEGERFPPRASRFSSLLTINSLNTINSFVFPHQNQHFLLAKTERHYFGFLIASDCKYRESIYNCKILSFILFFLKDPFNEPFHKNQKGQTLPREPFPLPK